MKEYKIISFEILFTKGSTKNICFENNPLYGNDPKHVFNLAKDFFKDNNINWWKTPLENSDMNPIENLWHQLKEHIRHEVKPRTK